MFMTQPGSPGVYAKGESIQSSSRAGSVFLPIKRCISLVIGSLICITSTKKSKKKKKMAGICPLILCSIILALCKTDCCLSTKTQNAQVCFEFLHPSVPLKLIFVSPLGLVKETSGLDSLLAALESTGYVHLFLATRIHYAFIYFDHDV